MTDLSKVYQNIGYGMRSIGFGKRPAVVVVDFQEAFLNDKYPLGRSPYIKRAAEQTAALLKTARSCNVPVMYTVVAYRDNGWDTGNWKTELSWITPGSEAAEVASVVKPEEGEPVILKKWPSAFFGTELISLLTIKGIDTLIVTGCVTSGCIRATIIDSFSYGFRTIVPDDCCGDHTEEQHRSNMLDVSNRYADIVDRQTVEAYMKELAEKGSVLA